MWIIRCADGLQRSYRSLRECAFREASRGVRLWLTEAHRFPQVGKPKCGAASLHGRAIRVCFTILGDM